MSLILDALNRSREDDGRVPGLATQHYTEDADGAGHWRRYLPWAALLPALLVIGWLLLQRDDPPAAPQALPPPAGAEQAPAPAVAQPPASQAIAESAEPEPQPPAPAAAPAALPEEPLRTVPGASAPSKEPVTAADPAVADLYRQSKPAQTESDPGRQQTRADPAAPADVSTAGTSQAPAAAERVAEEPIDIEEMVRQAREELENARLEEHAAPFITALSQQTKDSIPTIYYERHDYSGIPAQSSVVLNGKKLKVGGSPAAGVKVEEILADSVVLSYRGTQFRLRALNSWINL